MGTWLPASKKGVSDWATLFVQLVCVGDLFIITLLLSLIVFTFRSGVLEGTSTLVSSCFSGVLGCIDSGFKGSNGDNVIIYSNFPISILFAAAHDPILSLYVTVSEKTRPMGFFCEYC